MKIPSHVAIVGASLAGVRTAEALRRAAFPGEITLIGAELHYPYDRPPLSKGYLAGVRRVDQLTLRPAAPRLEDLDVRLVLGDPVRSIDLANGQLLTTAGSTVTFDGLVIASGTRLRHLPDELFTEATHPPVLGVRTLDDADRLRRHIAPDAHVVIIGAGFIGAEVASTASEAGASVSVVEAVDVPLARQLGAEMGAVVARLHQQRNVRLLTGTAVTAIDETGVVVNTGEHLRADVIVVGIGVVTNTEWLVGSDLDLTDGVLCDSALRAVGAPDAVAVVAVGDIARWPNTRFGETARVEHWTHAVESAEHAAQTLHGNIAPFEPVPYFWSDQYGAKIQCLGRTTGFDEVRVVAGSTDDLKFVALYRRGDRVVAALGLSMVKQLMGCRRLLLDRLSWDEALVEFATN